MAWIKALLFWLGALFISAVPATELQPFSTDGCSGFPDGLPRQQQLWRNCCIAHDLAYWRGGSYQDRTNADQDLKQCVAQLGETTIAFIMLTGVRLGGSPFWPTDFRWGYGWPYPRGYGSLSPFETQQIKDQLARQGLAQEAQAHHP